MKIKSQRRVSPVRVKPERKRDKEQARESSQRKISSAELIRANRSSRYSGCTPALLRLCSISRTKSLAVPIVIGVPCMTFSDGTLLMVTLPLPVLEQKKSRHWNELHEKHLVIISFSMAPLQDFLWIVHATYHIFYSLKRFRKNIFWKKNCYGIISNTLSEISAGGIVSPKKS